MFCSVLHTFLLRKTATDGGTVLFKNSHTEVEVESTFKKIVQRVRRWIAREETTVHYSLEVRHFRRKSALRSNLGTLVYEITYTLFFSVYKPPR